MLRTWARFSWALVSGAVSAIVHSSIVQKALMPARYVLQRFGVQSVGRRLFGLFQSTTLPKKMVIVGMSSILVSSILIELAQPLIVQRQDNLYAISAATEQLLVPKVSYYSSLIQENLAEETFEYNAGYSPGGDVAGQGARPKFSASIHTDPARGVTIRDAVNQTDITIKPLFDVGAPRVDENRVVYPMFGSHGGVMVMSLGTSGFKEDIIVNEFVSDALDHSYELVVPDGVEARIDKDGSLAFYGVSSALLGDVSTSTPEDEALLEQARQNGEKSTLLFRSPAPVVIERQRAQSKATAKYTLNGNVLTLHASNLRAANYPISIDPSVYVETARKLMRGNNESNIDFDIDNELIKKSFTTGARFDSWDNTTDLDEGRWNHGTAVAGGFIYAAGGERTSISQEVFSSSGADTFDVPAGVTEVVVKTWGAGGGGGGGSTNSDGGDGGGGGFAEATIATTPAETLNVIVGGGGTGGLHSSGGSGTSSGDGGGGGGHSEVNRSGTPLIIAAGGGGAGGGDNSGGGGGTDGGGGGAGGGTTGGSGGASSNAPGGAGGASGAGGAGGNGSGTDGTAGTSEQGGNGGNGGNNDAGKGAMNNGGSNGGGDGGRADETANGFGAGGGGGGGYFGGGGGSASISGNRGGGGGGGGSSYTTGTSTTNTSGTNEVPGNDSDTDRSGAGDGGSPGGTGTSAPASTGGDGADGLVIITYDSSSATIAQAQTPVTATCTDTDANCNVTATITAATAGNHIIAVCSGEGAGGWQNVIMDGYTEAAAEVVNDNMAQQTFFKTSLGGETSVTCRLRGLGSGVTGYLTVFEYSGLAGSPLDVTASNTGAGTVLTTGTPSVTTQPDVLFIAGHSTDVGGATFSGWTNSFTEETDHNLAGEASQSTASRVVTSTGAYSTGATASVSGDWIGQVTAFNADTLGTGSEARKEVYWAELSTADNSIDSPNPGAGACTGWCTNGAYDLPDERIGFSMVAYNGFLYIIGGEDESGVLQNTIYITKLGANGEPSRWHPTDSDQDSWDYWYSSSNTLTNATSYGAAAAYNNRLYFLGGDTAAGDVSTVYMAEFNPTGDIQAWSTVGQTAMPSDRHMHTVHTYNDYIYIVGGNSSGTLQNSVHYTNINTDGSLGTWTATNSFTTARSTWGGNYSVVWGGYLYLAGGCSAVDAGGECTTIANDVQLASINADGTIDLFSAVDDVVNDRIGYGFVAWDNALYRIGGCSNQDAATGECLSVVNDEDYAVINNDGDASTVDISEDYGLGTCVGATPTNCDLPDAGDGVGEGGHMLSSTVVINGYLYVIGGCTTFQCNSGDYVSGNTSYATINTDGSLGRPDTCSGSYAHEGNGTWCVDSTNRVNGTLGVATAGVAVFNNRIYLVGGVDGESNDATADISAIYHNAVNADGSLDGPWEVDTWADVGIPTGEEIFYSYAYARANPSAAGTIPGNLYIMGGCGDYGGTGIGCANDDFRTEVYKCDIAPDGDVTNCTTTGQLQIDRSPGVGGDDGVGAHAGTVYANKIYLIAGLDDDDDADRDEVIYAAFDDSNNVVAAEGESDWVVAANALSIPRRRGSGFGYNGYIYGVGGYEEFSGGDGTTIEDIEFAQVDVSSGDVGGFSTSAVTINQRWGLAMAVSNSFAYVIGGCDSGRSPNACVSFEPSVQTFQLYNNNSGSAAEFTQTGNQFNTDRYGGSAVVHGGYIYLAGGCTDAVGDCSTATNNVQYASIDPLGNIGTWASTTSLPASVGWGQLEEAGGTLYWIGGQTGGGVEQSAIYYATPNTSTGAIASWGTVAGANDLPAARTQFGAANWNDRLYVIGGLDGSASETNTVYISPDLSGGGNITSAWTSGGNLPDVARSGNTVVAYANNLYTFGGHDGSNYLLDSQFASIGYKDGTISQSGTTVTGVGTAWTTAQEGATIQYEDGITATITDVASGTSMTVDVDKTVAADSIYTILDGSVGSWTFTTPLPDKISQGDGFAANGYVYVVGGRSADSTCDSNTFIAPISANTFISAGNNPTGVGEWYETNERYAGSRFGNAVVHSDGRMHVLGGGCDETNIVVGGTATTYGEYTFDTATSGDEDEFTFSGPSGTGLNGEGGTNGEWTFDNDTTPSGTTTIGPNGGQEGTSDGYIYTEASGQSAGGEYTLTFDTVLDASTDVWDVDFYWNERGDDNEALIEVQTNENSAGWVTRETYGGGDIATSGTSTWNSVSADLTGKISDASTQVRLRIELPSVGSVWHNDVGIDGITITGTPYTSTTTFELTDTDRTIQTTLLSQPQIAKYSRLIDTDTDVFPTNFLFNGIDNSIGARWTTRYRSSTDDASAWGAETAFGDVELGIVNDYTPIDDVSADTSFSRFHYFFIEIDASVTYGYPEDVDRGPTLNDLSLFFTADPNKRLRHGKTFTGGEEQPLDAAPP